MTLSPIFLGSYSVESLRARTNASQFTSMKDTMSDLQRQLSTGKLSDDWAGLGTDRTTSLDLNARVSLLDGYASNNMDAQTRLKVMDASLAQLNKNRASAIGELSLDSYQLRSGGTTQGQMLITGRFNEMIDLLNQEVAGRFVFSGRATDTRPVASADVILNGQSPLIGLKTAIANQKTTDLGSGLGGLAVGVSGNVVSVTKPGAGGLTVSGPSSFDFTTQPTAGQAFTVALTLPDGTTEKVTLTAAAAPGAGTSAGTAFVIGATSAQTAANFGAALSTALGTVATTSLSAASAVKASQDFFAGSIPNTVQWYLGDNSATPRQTALVRASDGAPIASGGQANETPFKNLLATYAVMAAETFPSSDPTSPARYDAVKSRLQTSLAETPGARIADVQTELALASVDINTANERNASTKKVLQDHIGAIEDASPEEVATQLLALQTRLQASYQTASLVSKLSLVNYLS
jgi:flagellar hook-associated protein 3 FlgL